MPKWRECWCISLRWGKTLKGPAWQMILETFFLCLRIEILFFVELPLLILFRNFLDFPLDIRISLRPLFNFFYSFQSTNYFYNKSMLKLIHLVVSVASIWTCGFLIMSITTFIPFPKDLIWWKLQKIIFLQNWVMPSAEK